MSSIKEELRALWLQAQKLELDAKGLASAVPGKVAVLSVADATDVGFLCREISNICDSLKKTFKARQDLVGQSLALKSGAAAIRGEDLKLEGELARGSVSCDNEPRIPHHDSPEFLQLMAWLGVPPEVASRGALRPSFRRLTDEINRRVSNGEKLPPGINAAYAKMTVTFRKKSLSNQVEEQDVTEEE
jgi:hypothetical protein